MGPVVLRIGEARPSLEQQHVEPAPGKLLSDDGAAAACSDHDHVAHDSPPFVFA